MSRKATKAMIKSALAAHAKPPSATASVAATAQVDGPSNADIQAMISSSVAAAVAPLMALIGSVDKKPPATTKPRSILKAPPKIGSTTATNVVRVSTSNRKLNLLKVREAAQPVSPLKRAAARTSDSYEDARIPKKTKMVEVAADNDTEEETDAE